MKILAFSDLHRDQATAQMIVDASDKADVIVGAGDFANRREGAQDTLNILKNCHAPVVLVHGNHDDPDEVSLFCQNWEHGHYLHGRSLVIGGKSFYGLGGEIPPRNTLDWNVAETEEHASLLLNDCPKDAILVTHSPPFGVADLQKYGAHIGSAAIRDAALIHQPNLILCGHIHSAWGMTGTIGSTYVHNLGPTLNWFDV